MPKLEDWLASLGLSEYVVRFAQNRVDASILPYLTDHDLRELGIPFGDRKRMLRAISELEAQELQTSTAATRSTPGEKRQVTVMFCDLTDSTALSARLDPEDLQEVIEAYRDVCARIILSYGGFLAQFLGDGILAYFGFPHAHENDAERAVRAGLDIAAAVPQVEVPGSEMLSARIGLATGVVVVGDLVARDGPEEQTVVGDTPNIAARLQALAVPGTVVISGSTHRLTTGYFEYADLGRLELKGLADPIEAWQVVRPSKVESRFEAEHGVGLPPLLGRDEEIELLSRRWRQSVAGEGRVVLLTGEPGIGKSHIVLTFQEQLGTDSHLTFRYFCSSHYTHSTLFPFISQLERSAGFERGDTPAEKYAKLEALFAQPAPSVPILASLLGLSQHTQYGLDHISPQKRKETILSAFLAQLKSAAVLSPVLMVFEDAHWIDPTSLELLTNIVQEAPQLRLLLLITARPEFIPPWPNHAHVTTLALTRLSRSVGAELVERVTVGKPLPKHVLEKILAQTDGVPLFIEELTKTVLESGLLKEQDGRYVLDRPLPSFAIPTTLYASLMARLDRLGSVKEVAQIGAAAGREFSYELVRAISELPNEKLEAALDQLVRSELVFCRGEKSERIYTFKHVLVRDAAYAGLLKGRRAELHAAIAKAFEQRFPDVAEAEPESLAYHLTHAGFIEKAVGYWIRAGKKAAARSADLEALAHLERGLEAVGQLGEDRKRDRLELDLRFALAPCLIATQGPAGSGSMTTFSRAHQLCVRLGDAPEYLQVMFWLVTARVVRGELPQALEEIGILTRLAEARADHAALLNAIRGRAMILLFMGRVGDAHDEIRRAITKFEMSDEGVRLNARSAGQDAGAAALALMSWSLWLTGNVKQSTETITAALRRANSVEHPHTQAYVSYYASVLYALRGETNIALEHAEHCLGLSEEHGFGQWRNLSRAIRGISTAVLHPATDMLALDEVREAFNDYRRAGYGLGVTALDVLWSPVLLLYDQPEAALEVIEQGLSIAERNNERIFEPELYRLKAKTLLAREASCPDATSRAEELLRHGMTIAKNQNARVLEFRAAKDLATLWIAQGQKSEAIYLLAPLFEALAEGLDTQDLEEGRSVLYARN